MDMSLEARQALVLMLRDFEQRRLPRALALLDQAASGDGLSEADHAFFSELLDDIDHAASLVGDDLESRLAVARLRTCTENLSREIAALASGNAVPLRAAG